MAPVRVSRALSFGDHGQEVRALQERLGRLGYSGVDGHALQADGDFGRSTKYAVRRFQRAHGLDIDGVVGDDTRAALIKSERTPLLSERTHADYPIFREALSKLKQFPSGTIQNNDELDRAAAALASVARQAGLTQIDHVMMNTRADGLIAVQGNPQDPGRHVASIDRSSALTQSLEQSTARLAQVSFDRHQSEQMQVRSEQMEHRAGLVFGIRP